ncbi:eukaryotic translation initiation factor 3 subunit J-like [Lytechinus variegatus]|uniref:eukaryotic translation initiation factor 3 subunit J-like n=1 Tax=Lytechinus variegatus TaxID=7654 RepID=UPI001BB1492D|nr:eukaryotic translation initiation factor 3 subunit J-like [Lytechinus variegatus]
MADWEDDDFDPDAGFAKATTGDKWEGEDEEEDVKDDWAASDEEEEKEEKKEAGSTEQTATSGAGGAFQVKKKKTNLEKSLQRKAEKRKEKLKEAEKVTLTPEEELEEKLRQQKLQEESDLELAKEAFGVGLDDDRSLSLDTMNPTTEEEFTEFGKLLKEKLSMLESSDYYPFLLEDVFQSCCVCLDSEQVKKLGSCLTAIANEKAKAQKASKGKKGKKKAVLAGSGKSAKKDEFDDFGYGGGEFDDFM